MNLKTDVTLALDKGLQLYQWVDWVYEEDLSNQVHALNDILFSRDPLSHKFDIQVYIDIYNLFHDTYFIESLKEAVIETSPLFSSEINTVVNTIQNVLDQSKKLFSLHFSKKLFLTQLDDNWWKIMVEDGNTTFYQEIISILKKEGFKIEENSSHNNSLLTIHWYDYAIDSIQNIRWSLFLKIEEKDFNNPNNDLIKKYTWISPTVLSEMDFYDNVWKIYFNSEKEWREFNYFENEQYSYEKIAEIVSRNILDENQASLCNPLEDSYLNYEWYALTILLNVMLDHVNEINYCWSYWEKIVRPLRWSSNEYQWYLLYLMIKYHLPEYKEVYDMTDERLLQYCQKNHYEVYKEVTIEVKDFLDFSLHSRGIKKDQFEKNYNTFQFTKQNEVLETNYYYILQSLVIKFFKERNLAMQSKKLTKFIENKNNISVY